MEGQFRHCSYSLAIVEDALIGYFQNIKIKLDGKALRTKTIEMKIGRNVKDDYSALTRFFNQSDSDRY